MARKNIRNFCIIAHIDHGKSTLSDRMLELTDSVDKRTMTDQVLDDMDIEKERGITIKARAVTMRYNLEVVPILNKIDLPSADPDAVAKEVEDVIGLPCMEAPRVSAKLGIGVKEVLESVARDIPAPTGDPDAPLKALIFDPAIPSA